MLLPYHPDPVEFKAILMAHNAIISGSTALHFCMNNLKWDVNDLDIYVPESSGVSLVAALNAMGYKILDWFSMYPSTHAIKSCMKIVK
jgi:hypothetical protein